jgi:hypothetical protein
MIGNLVVEKIIFNREKMTRNRFAGYKAAGIFYFLSFFPGILPYFSRFPQNV